MKLYEIDSELEKLVDSETGEITDFDAFEQLSLTREQKLENLLIYIKNTNSDVSELDAEIKNLTARKKVAENAANRAIEYAKFILKDENFKTSKVVASFRNTQSVNISDEEAFVEWAKQNAPQLLSYSDPKPSKTAIKESISRGDTVEYCSMQHNSSLTVK